MTSNLQVIRDRKIQIHAYDVRFFGTEWERILSCMSVHVQLVMRTRNRESNPKQPCKTAMLYSNGTRHLDILGPFPTSESGNKYVLVMVDQFTKWTELKALPNQTAELVANATVTEFICRAVPIKYSQTREVILMDPFSNPCVIFLKWPNAEQHRIALVRMDK